MSALGETAGGVLAGISDELANAVEQAGRSIVAVQARRHVAAGGIAYGQNTVVTADHVIEQEDEVTVVLPDGQKVKATLAGRDAGTDVAVLRLDGVSLTPATLADSTALRVGQLALAIARPGGEGLAASIGIISAINGSWRTWRGGTVDALIRTDLTLYPGFSGGPLVDAQGRVIGMNTSGLSRGTTLALPTATIKRVADALLTRGRISRGYLGVQMQPVGLPSDLASKLSLTQTGGLMIVSVEADGPAARGSILLGDILVGMQEKTLDDAAQVQQLLDPESVGKTFPVRLIRGGELRTVQVTVGERPR